MSALTDVERQELLDVAPYSCIPNSGEMQWTYEIVERIIEARTADLLDRLERAEAEAERDRLAAAVERVEALADGAAYAGRHINGYSYVLVTDLRAALSDAGRGE